MTSQRHTDDRSHTGVGGFERPAHAFPPPDHSPNDDAILDAARARLLAVGWKRVTLTDIARAAGVSRMTIYRRWPDVQAVMGDLMAREWTAVGAAAAADVVRHEPQDYRTALTRTMVSVGITIRRSEVFQRILDVDPELLLTYLIDRRGRTQDSLLQYSEPAIRAGQASGDIREGDSMAMAVTLLLAAHGFVISAGTVADLADERTLAAELTILMERYLAP